MVATDPAKWGDCKWGYFRWGVKNTLFEDLIASFKGSGSCTVTRRKLSLGERDSTTGWRAKSYTEDTISAVYFPRGSTQMTLKAGTYVRADALLICIDGLAEGNEVKTPDNKYWEVKAVREFYRKMNDLSHREVDLTYLPLHT